MYNMVKKSTKIKISLGISVFVGISFAYFLYLSWLNLTEWIGNSNVVWAITGGILLLAIIFGYFGIDKIIKKFL